MAQQDAGESPTPLLAGRKQPGGEVGKIEQIESIQRPFHIALEKPRFQREILPQGQSGFERICVAEIGDIQSLLGVMPVTTAHREAASLERTEPGQNAQQRRFARTVWSRQQQSLTGRQREACSVQNKAHSANHGYVMQDEPGCMRRGKT